MNNQNSHVILKTKTKNKSMYRMSQKTWEFSDELDIVFVMN